mgnify:FL=1
MIFNEISDYLLRLNIIHAVGQGNLAHLYIILWKNDRILFNLSARKEMLQLSFISYLHSYPTLVLSCNKDIYLLIPFFHNVYNKVLTFLLLEKLFTLNVVKFFCSTAYPEHPVQLQDNRTHNITRGSGPDVTRRSCNVDISGDMSDATTPSTFLISSIPFFISQRNILICCNLRSYGGKLCSYLFNFKLLFEYISKDYCIIVRKHPEEPMSKSISLKMNSLFKKMHFFWMLLWLKGHKEFKPSEKFINFLLFMQKMHFFWTLFWLKKHEVYKPAKKLCYCHLKSSNIPFILSKVNFLLTSGIIGYIFASQLATYALLTFFPSLLFFFQHLLFLSLIHSKELTSTISLTRPLLGDNRVLCDIFNFPILVPLVFSLPIPTLINMHKKKLDLIPSLTRFYLMTTVLTCSSSFLS